MNNPGPQIKVHLVLAMQDVIKNNGFIFLVQRCNIRKQGFHPRYMKNVGIFIQCNLLIQGSFSYQPRRVDYIVTSPSYLERVWQPFMGYFI